MFEDVIQFVRGIYGDKKNIPLHEPSFIGNEKKYLSECIDSTFVSSAGKYVDEFENKIAAYVGSKFAIATTNGTSALHISLLIAGVNKNDEVITQPLTFVATCNAISYCGANPVFVDVDRETMGLSPKSLKNFLSTNTIIKNNQCVNTLTGRVIKACLPMHTFGFPCRIDEIRDICLQYNIFLIEDCAESLGSFYKDQHTGTFGKLSVMSFNGNKIITAGGGGCILTNDEVLAKKAKHLCTTAKVSHKWEYTHDSVGYNYRMPNLNAALLIAQLENLDLFLFNKRELATKYISFFNNSVHKFVEDPQDCHSNYWLNTIILENKHQRDFFLNELNSNGIMSRPAWTLMNKLPMFNNAQSDGISNSKWLEDRIVNLPSSPII
jgi:perosamine synthetase